MYKREVTVDQKLPYEEVHFRNFSEATVVNESIHVTKRIATVLWKLAN